MRQTLFKSMKMVKKRDKNCQKIYTEGNNNKVKIVKFGHFIQARKLSTL